jgi:glutathione S-transferase
VKLYNHSHAPNPRRVRVFLAEKGIEVVLEEIDILAGQSRTPEFLAKNSSGGVPLLELDDGSYLSESVAICRYLEGLHPEPNLLGRDLREQAEIERWNRRLELELMAAIGRLKIPVRSFKDVSSNSRNTAKRSERWFISVSSGWIASWTDINSLPATVSRLPTSRRWSQSTWALVLLI